jgi:hypothetical protein
MLIFSPQPSNADNQEEEKTQPAVDPDPLPEEEDHAVQHPRPVPVFV